MLTLHTLNDQICPHFNDAAHATEVAPNARYLFCNGQVGSRLDGSVPETPKEQLHVTFERIGAILTAGRMTFQDIVRLSVYVTDKSIIDAYQDVRDDYLGDHKPPTILLVVGPFPRPGIEVEIEAIAAKADG